MTRHLSVAPTFVLGIVAACMALANQSVFAGDWAYWRGPEQDGVSRETGLVDDWDLESGKNVLWSDELGGRATPIVVNDRLYLNCRTLDDVNDPDTKIHAREQVVCRDANTGEVLWKDVFNVFQTDIPAPRVGWAAMVGDSQTGNVYVHSVSGLFRCYDKDGKVLWEKSLFEDFGKISGYGGRTQTPIIDENRIIVGFLVRNWGATKGPAPKHTHYCFDKTTGELLWVSAPGGKPNDTTYSNPLIRVIDGQRQFICGDADGGIYGINARTGEKIWGFRMSKRGLNSSPAIEENRVYISHGEDNIDAVAFGRIQCIDLSAGTGDLTENKAASLWRIDNIKAGYTGLLVKDGILYVVTDTGKLIAFDSKTGEELWEFPLGTVGKGSPVWADGKLYVMEVNGNVHILKPTREKCESLSSVELPDGMGVGTDEIYASPAISKGKVFLVTRDRTICLGNKDAETSADPIPPLAEEADPTGEVALIQLYPYEKAIMGGGEIEYEVHAFDAKGRFLKKLEDASLEVDSDLPGAEADGLTLSFGDDVGLQAGTVKVTSGDLTASARVRHFPSLPWKFDFDDLKEGETPPGWINGAAKLKQIKLDDENTALIHGKAVVGRPSNYIWLGPSTMSGYTIQSDVMLEEAGRRLPNAGVTANRYNLFIKGNYLKLAVQSWPPHKRMAEEVRFRADPDIWYTVKLKVVVKPGENGEKAAHIFGKVWKREDDEPEEWTLETVDPHANETGSPGIYVYALAGSKFDNLTVTENEKE